MSTAGHHAKQPVSIPETQDTSILLCPCQLSTSSECPSSVKCPHSENEFLTIIEEPSLLDQQTNSIGMPVESHHSLALCSEQTAYKVNQCDIHHKPLDILCLIDRVLICSSCALFGQHKGHQFNDLTDINQETARRQKAILDIIGQMKQFEKQKAPLISLANTQRLLSQRNQELTVKLQTGVANIIMQLRECETRCLERMEEQTYQSKQKYVVVHQRILTVSDRASDWQKLAAGHVQSMQRSSTLEEKLKTLDIFNPQHEIASCGRSVLLELQNAYSEVQNQKSKCLGQIDVIFDQALLNNLGNFARLQTSVDRDSGIPSKKTASETNISIGGAQNRLGQPVKTGFLDPNWLHMNTSLLSLETSMRSCRQSPHSKHFVALSPRKSGQTGETLSPRTRPRSPQYKLYTPSEMARDRRIKLKLPQKYDKLMQEIIGDTTEVFDLTNGQLGNDSILLMLELLKVNYKVRVVKLAKNRLTDDLLPSLWSHLGKVVTLNLAHNSFSERVVDSFMSHIPLVPVLKNIVLTQNRLTPRSLKAKVQQLRQLGILVTL